MILLKSVSRASIAVRFVIALGGFAIYSLLLFFWFVQWQQRVDIHQSSRTELWFILSGVFAAGLPPLALAWFFLFSSKTRRDYLYGAALVALFIVVHYIVVVWMAHGAFSTYAVMMGLEIFCTGGLIWYWRK